MIEFGSNINWLIPLVLLSGVLTWALYFFRPDAYSQKIKPILAALRFMGLFLTGLFLLNPVITYQDTEEEKPIYILGIDQSKSMVSNSDSLEVQNAMDSIIETVGNRGDIDLKILTFGSEISNYDTLSFAGESTNISEYLQYVDDNFGYQNLAGHTVISDGIFNNGLDPQYAPIKNQVAIDVIAFGDTVKRPDQSIAEVRYNRLVYKGNKFPVVVNINSKSLKGKSTELLLTTSGGKQLTMPIKYTAENDFQTINFQLEYEKTGIQLISAELLPIKGESNLDNNKQTFSVEVLDEQEKIAIVYQTLQPDIGAIKKVISKNENISVDLFSSGEISLELISKLMLEYNGLVLYQIPGIKNTIPPKLLKALFETNLPTMYILGTNTNVDQITRLSKELTQKGRSAGMFNSVSGVLNDNFSRFTTPENSALVLRELAPLSAPFGEFSVKGKSSTYLFQKIGAVASELPLWTFSEFNGKPVIFVFGSGFWRWPLEEHRKFQNQQFFDNLISSSMSFLTVKKDKSRLKVKTKSNYSSSEDAVIQAEVYNDLYESINDPELRLKLNYKDSLSYDYSFSRNDIGYELNLGKLQPGLYAYAAETEIGGETLKKKGQFTVTRRNIERIKLEADYQTLFKIANRTGGKFYSKESFSLWFSNLEKSEFSSTLYEHTNFRDLIDVRWLFALIVLLFGLEWFFRKRSGYL